MANHSHLVICPSIGIDKDKEQHWVTVCVSPDRPSLPPAHPQQNAIELDFDHVICGPILSR